MGGRIHQKMSSAVFYAQGRIWKFAALQHAARAASREKNLPYSIVKGRQKKLGRWRISEVKPSADSIPEPSS